MEGRRCGQVIETDPAEKIIGDLNIMESILLYDTTLRDGTQGEKITFTVKDKLRIAKKLDDLGIHFIEGGWPGSNNKDYEFFESLKNENFQNSRITAFGSTHRAGVSADKDKNLKAIIECGASVATIFGKTWDLHVKKILRINPEDNLNMIRDSVKHLKQNGLEVHYDAEHFFDGYKDNSQYAIKTLAAAIEGGADFIVFCDTNGGSLPHEVETIVHEVVK